MKPFFTKAVVALFLSIPLLATIPATGVHAATVNTVVKGSSSTLYWYASNGNRYVFPNATTYYTWFPDFKNVQNVSNSELSNMPLAGTITFRPGAKLVKIQTDPKVYAVSRYGILHWVTSEWLASQLYGANWASQVRDVPVEFFSSYTMGNAINNPWEYNVGQEYNGVSNPSDSLSGAINPFLPILPTSNLNVTISRTSLNQGESVTVNGSANASWLPLYGWLDIIQVNQNGTTVRVASCQQSTCAATVMPTSASTNFRLEAYNQNRQLISTTTSGTVTMGTNGSTYGMSMNLTANVSSIYSGNTVTLTATAYNQTGYTYSGSHIDVIDLRTNGVVNTCYNQSTCYTTLTVNRNGTESSVQYVAIIRDSNGTELARGYSSTISFTGTTTGTVGSLSLNMNQSSIASGNLVQFYASVNNASGYDFNGSRIELVDMRNGATIYTCYNQSWCNPALTITRLNNETSATYYAVLKNSVGTEVVRGFSSTLAFTNPVVVNPPVTTDRFDSATYLTASLTSHVVNAISETDSITANLVNAHTDANNITINFYDGATGLQLTSCGGSTSCTATIMGATPLNHVIYARAFNQYGQMVESNRLSL